MELPGRATPEGTARFAGRHPEAAAGHFRPAQGWTVSSVGLGTYLGEPDDPTDAGYGRALETAVDMGCNVVDTAIVYRHQRSERAVGRTLGALVADGKVGRDEVVVATKGGFLPYDAAHGGSPTHYIEETLLRPGIITAADVAGGTHCMTPRYLRHQLGLSRGNLRCSTVDIYYVHNPESQLRDVDRPEVLRRLRAACEALEEAAEAGEIGVYGTATWTAYRSPPGAPDHLSLAELVDCARDVAGDGHRFRCVQAPLSLAMPEAVAAPTQERGGERLPLLAVAAELGLTVMASASLMQARLVAGLPPALRAALDGGLTTDAQRALQFVRSAPGLTTALVGMSDPAHAVENLAVVAVPPLGAARFEELMAG